MAFREADTDIVIPSVVHLAIGHYAAVVRHEGGAYLIRDPTFGDDHWVSRAALASESSGYSLIPSAAFGPGWRDVTPDEGRSVWGKGLTTGGDDRPHGCNDPSTGRSVRQE